MKRKVEEQSSIDLDININELQEIPTKIVDKPETKRPDIIKHSARTEEDFINCLRNERIIVRHIPKETGLVTNPKHLLYGGMAENAVRYFVVPRLSSGMYVNILTDSEKAFLEDAMGLEYNALSIYKKHDNFWDDSSDLGISRVRLTKQDNYLDLSDPEDYIRYKILLANKDFIAPSLQHLEDNPKVTYQFVVISEGSESKIAKSNMDTKMKCYKEYGKVEDDKYVLRVIVEALEGKPTSDTVQLEFLQARIDNLIQSDSKSFYRTITDPMLNTKVLIKKSIEAGLISNRDGKLYLRADNSPLCEHNEESTLNNAARYLNSPRRQEIKFALEAKLK